MLNFKKQGNAEFAGKFKCRDEVDDNPFIQELGSTFVSVDIKVGSKLGTGLDRGCRTAVVLDIKVGSKLGTILGIALGTEH